MDIVSKLMDQDNNILHELKISYDIETNGKGLFSWQFDYFRDKGDTLTELGFLESEEEPFGEVRLFNIPDFAYSHEFDKFVPITSRESLTELGMDNDSPDEWLDSDYEPKFYAYYTKTIDSNSPLKEIISQLNKLIDRLYIVHEVEKNYLNDTDRCGVDFVNDLLMDEFDELTVIPNHYIEDDGLGWFQVVNFIKFSVQKIERNPQLVFTYTEIDYKETSTTGEIYKFVDEFL